MFERLRSQRFTSDNFAKTLLYDHTYIMVKLYALSIEYYVEDIKEEFRYLKFTEIISEKIHNIYFI